MFGRQCSGVTPLGKSVREDKPATFQRVVIDGVLGMAAGFLTASLYLMAQIAITGKLDLPGD